MKTYKVAVVGATGMVGQRFTLLLEHHPWFQVTCLAASARSAGKTYREAVEGRWAFKDRPIPANVADMTVLDAAQVEEVASRVDFVFCAVDMKKDEIRALEERYARTETPVVSNNSANRGVSDVPMLIPEINGDHAAVIEAQRKRLGTKNGFIAVKPNCSIQSYVPALWPLLDFEPKKVMVCTYQAISGAGKTFERWPEMVDNVIPYIGGEDEKSAEASFEHFVEFRRLLAASIASMNAMFPPKEMPSWTDQDFFKAYTFIRDAYPIAEKISEYKPSQLDDEKYYRRIVEIYQYIDSDKIQEGSALPLSEFRKAMKESTSRKKKPRASET